MYGHYVREHIPLQPEMTCDPAVVSVTAPVVPSFSHRPGVWITCRKKQKQKSVMLMSEIEATHARKQWCTIELYEDWVLVKVPMK